MTRKLTLFRNGLFLFTLTAFSAPAANAQYGGECGAYAGSTLMAYGPECLEGGHAIISGTPNGDAVVPDGFTTAFLLSRTNALIVEQVGPTPYFQVGTADVWRIHTLVFDPQTFDPSDIDFGVTSAYDVAAQFTQTGGPICAAISFTVYGSKTVDCNEPCEAFAAPVTMDTTTVCLVEGQATLTAQLDGTHVVPDGYEVRYLLSRTNGLIIEQVADAPSFTVNSMNAWRIHAFVYDPSTFDMGSIVFGETSIYDIYPQLVQGGGTICANLQMNGAFVKTGECKKDCEAEAGGLSPVHPDLCLIDGMATATAVPDGSTQVPGGSELVYFLAHNGVIIAIGEDPSFTITSLGEYLIVAFVYDPGTFDITSVAAGGTTVDEVASLIGQGAEAICASLGLPGALFEVTDCTPSCEADAGAMVGGGPVCLEGGLATLAAASFGDTLVPPGFDLVYLLSEGPGMVLQAWHDEASFVVDHEGGFRIHAFVHDPATMDLDALDWGTTTILDLNGQLVQGGGSLCAGLDVLGAAFTVEACAPPCDAGTDTVITVCLTDPEFHLFPLLGETACPEGIWTSPSAQVENGVFDPATSTAGVYTYTVPGPNGTMDTATVTVNVVECPAACEGAGTDATITVCYTDPAFNLFDFLGGDPCPDGTWTNVANPQASGWFDPASDAAGDYTYTVTGPDGMVYTAVVTVNVFECPEDVDAWPGGTTGVVDADGTASFALWPNPATDHVQVALPEDVPNARIELVAADGRVYKAQTVQRTNRSVTLSVSALPAGLWTVRIIGTGHQYMGRFIR